MKRKIKNLVGFSILATDGEIGKVTAFYFDDETWTVRYLVVETGSWLFGRKILLSPEALLTPNWEKELFPVNLTMEQIKSSPDIDTNKPVSRQHELDLHNHYPWTSYWGGGLWAGGMGTSGMMGHATLPLEEAIENEQLESGKATSGDQHLRSTDEVTGYHIEATDGRIGDVEDFLIDDTTWKIEFMEVDTGHWFPGKKVLIAPRWIRQIDWAASLVIVNASEEQVKNSPEYVPNQELSNSYESGLLNYYGRFITHK